MSLPPSDGDVTRQQVGDQNHKVKFSSKQIDFDTEAATTKGQNINV